MVQGSRRTALLGGVVLLQGVPDGALAGAQGAVQGGGCQGESRRRSDEVFEIPSFELNKRLERAVVGVLVSRGLLRIVVSGSHPGALCHNAHTQTIRVACYQAYVTPFFTTLSGLIRAPSPFGPPACAKHASRPPFLTAFSTLCFITPAPSAFSCPSILK
jgi:hypothetical protein